MKDAQSEEPAIGRNNSVDETKTISEELQFSNVHYEKDLQNFIENVSVKILKSENKILLGSD